MRNRPKNWRTQKAKAKATWNTSTCAQLYVWMYRLIYIQIHICMWQAVRGRANSVVRRAALTRFQQRQHDQKNKKKKEFANGLNDSTSRPETCPLCALTHVS